MTPQGTQVYQKAGDIAVSILEGDLGITVGVRMVVTVVTTLVTMVDIEATVAEITGVSKEIVSRAEMDQTAMEKIVMGRLYTVDVVNPGM